MTEGVEMVGYREEILYAEVDPRKLTGPRFQLDVAGHYGRPDVFHLTVRRRVTAHMQDLRIEQRLIQMRMDHPQRIGP